MTEPPSLDNLPKNRLRATTTRTLLANAPPDGLSAQSIKLFILLITDSESRSAALDFCQKQHPIPLVTNVIDILYAFFSTNNKISADSNSCEIFQILLECVNKQLPSTNNKVDVHILTFIDSISKLAFLFAKGNILQFLTSNLMPSNQHQIAFLMSTLSHFEDITPYLSSIQQYFTAKPSLSTLTFSVLALLTKHEKIENVPTVKTVVSFYKSLPENEIASYSIPTILCFVGQRLQSQILKEIPPFIAYLIRKVKKDVEHIPNLCSFIDKFLEFPDSVALIRPLQEDLVQLFISNVQKTDVEINDSISDPLLCGQKYIVSSFLNLASKLGISPLEILSQIKDTNIGMLILAFSAVSSSEKYETEEIENFLAPLITQISKQSISPNYQFLTRICGICANKFSSKSSLKILVSALATGSKSAYDYLINDTISFEFIFPEIVNGFKPGRIDGLYIQALQSLLQVNMTTLPDQPPPLDTDSTFSDSNFDCSVSDFAQLKSIESDDQDKQIHGSPTTTTTLFCSVISSVSDFPELTPLLGPSAASISNQFSIDLLSNIQKSKHKALKMELLAAFSNSIENLDIELIHSLALTFLMLLPGQAMLFLAISLQRLPRQIILTALQKVVTYAHSSPDLFSRMVALIAHSHPDIALSYIDAFITSSVTKRRVFFIFRTLETSDETLVVVFKTIGYCSSFIETSFFVNDFLPFSTSFMNKHLTQIPKNPDVAHSSLFSIRKMCYRIAKLQQEASQTNADNVFPFKDFLVAYVTNFLKDKIEKTESKEDGSSYPSILQTLATLIPLRPIRVNDRYESALECAATLLQICEEKVFSSVLKAAQQLFLVLMESNPSLFVFIGIALPVFPSFSHNKSWYLICPVMHEICSHCIQMINFAIQTSNTDLTQAISSINALIVNVIPLVCTEECGKVAADMIFDLVTLQYSIQNQIASHSKLISPKKMELTLKSPKFDGDELSKIVCSFLAKSLTTSQVFDIITALLDTLSDKKLLVIHHEGTALIIKHLLEAKGSEEFRYDTKIVRGLIETSDSKSEDVISVFMDIIDIISTMRLHSVLSVLVSQLELKDGVFEKIINRIIRNGKSAESLVKYLAENILSDTFSKEASNERFIWFAEKTVPLLGNVINVADSQTWAKLFVGVLKLIETSSGVKMTIDSTLKSNSTKSQIESPNDSLMDLSIESPIKSPMFRALFDDEDLNEIEEYAEKTVKEHRLALPMILANFPENPTNYVRLVSLLLAFYSTENCHSFLEYALKLENDRAPFGNLKELTRIFENTSPSEIWCDLSPKIVPIIVNSLLTTTTNSNISNNGGDGDENSIKCAATFISHTKTESRKIFWELMANRAMENLNRFSMVLLKISDRDVEIEIEPLVPIIPYLVLSTDFVDDEKNEIKGKVETKEIKTDNKDKLDVKESKDNKDSKETKDNKDYKECKENKEDPKVILLHRIYSQLSKEAQSNDSAQIINKTVQKNAFVAKFLKLKAFELYRDEFLCHFVEKMNTGDHVSKCIFCISTLVQTVDDKTASFIEATIMQLPHVEQKDQIQISTMIQNVLT